MTTTTEREGGTATAPATEGRSRDLVALFERCQSMTAAWRARLKALVEEHEAIEAEQHRLMAEALQLREMANHQAGTFDLQSVLDEHERTLILWALACTGGLQRHAAAMLGLGASTLNAKMKRLGITSLTSRNGSPPD